MPLDKISIPPATTTQSLHNDEITIAVMGASGTGKSTFINIASGSHLQVGVGLKSCTSTINHSDVFDIGGVPVRLIDTPGFDDTVVSDTDILKLIASYFASELEQGRKLSGVIYMHRISDVRMGGTARKNFAMFRKLCGEQFLGNVAIVTNMWSSVPPSVGEAREKELCTDELLYKPVLDKGSRIMRHNGTSESARAILQQFLFNPPLTLRIQQEIVNEQKDITETAACGELDRELEELKKVQEEELRDLREQLEEAKRAHDAETMEEVETARKEIEEKLQSLRNRREKLSEEYREMGKPQSPDVPPASHHRKRPPIADTRELRSPSIDEIAQLRAQLETKSIEEEALRRTFEQAEERHKREVEGLKRQVKQVQAESKKALRSLMMKHAVELKVQAEKLVPRLLPHTTGEGTGRHGLGQTVASSEGSDASKRKVEESSTHELHTKRRRDEEEDEHNPGCLPFNAQMSRKDVAIRSTLHRTVRSPTIRGWPSRLSSRTIDSEWQMVVCESRDQVVQNHILSLDEWSAMSAQGWTNSCNEKARLAK
ncbi:hypothetical protein NLI96_g5611 [Meripilus lineatus]|uniref:G domain-containing protein n=1 Tax=Meripilus lineatus TaxID=2056292 RepID=A0AAD5V4T1_9APHY|nr:hypothetical protein NLI96_g5611 [Physisporinus lineatus]